MNTNIHYILLLSLLLSACHNEAEQPDDIALYPVSFTLSGIEQLTRAVSGEVTDLTAGQTFTVAAYNPNTKAFVAQSQYKVNAAGTGLELDASSDMFLSAGTYDFCAIVPGQKLSSSGQGKIAPGVDALGSTTRAQMRAEATSITLHNLKHLASQISFTARVVKEDNPITTFEVRQIAIDSMVTYTNSQAEVVIDNYRLPENELIIPALDAPDRYSTTTITNTTDNPTFDYQANAPAGKSGKHYNIQKKPLVVYPRANGSFEARITINIYEPGMGSAEEKTVSAKINHLAFEPGKHYLFEVNYGWDFVNFQVTVSPWTNVDNDHGQVGSGEQEVKTTFAVDAWGNLVELGGDMGGA